jgi:hypothetical protein
MKKAEKKGSGQDYPRIIISFSNHASMAEVRTREGVERRNPGTSALNEPPPPTLR